MKNLYFILTFSFISFNGFSQEYPQRKWKEINSGVDTVESKEPKKTRVGYNECILNNLVFENYNELLSSFVSDYYIEDENGDKWRNNSMQTTRYSGININGYYLLPKVITMPWLCDTNYVKKKDEATILGKITNTTDNEFKFDPLGKEMVVGRTKSKSNLLLGSYNKEEHDKLIIISSGSIDDKIIKDVESLEAFSELSMVRIEASYDKYYGSYVLAPRYNFGRIEFDVIAMGIPSSEAKDSQPRLYKITKGDVSDFMNMKKKHETEGASKKKTTTSKSSKKKSKKRKKFLGIF